VKIKGCAADGRTERVRGMKCKYCGAEVPREKNICPYCGSEAEAPDETEKLKGLFSDILDRINKRLQAYSCPDCGSRQVFVKMKPQSSDGTAGGGKNSQYQWYGKCLNCGKEWEMSPEETRKRAILFVMLLFAIPSLPYILLITTATYFWRLVALVLCSVWFMKSRKVPLEIKTRWKIVIALWAVILIISFLR